MLLVYQVLGFVSSALILLLTFCFVRQRLLRLLRAFPQEVRMNRHYRHANMSMVHQKGALQGVGAPFPTVPSVKPVVRQ